MPGACFPFLMPFHRNTFSCQSSYMTRGQLMLTKSQERVTFPADLSGDRSADLTSSQLIPTSDIHLPPNGGCVCVCLHM